MNILETIRAEIRQRIKKYGKLADAAWGKDDPFAAETNEKIVSELQSLIVFTYTFPEQPASEGLEDEIVNYYGNIPDDEDKVEAARHFAEWQKNKMMEEAVEANLLSIEVSEPGIAHYTFEGKKVPAAFTGRYFGYKIIVIKDEK